MSTARQDSAGEADEPDESVFNAAPASNPTLNRGGRTKKACADCTRARRKCVESCPRRLAVTPATPAATPTPRPVAGSAEAATSESTGAAASTSDSTVSAGLTQRRQSERPRAKRSLDDTEPEHSELRSRATGRRLTGTFDDGAAEGCEDDPVDDRVRAPRLAPAPAPACPRSLHALVCWCRLDDATAGGEPMWMSIAKGKLVVNDKSFKAAGGAGANGTCTIAKNWSYVDIDWLVKIKTDSAGDVHYENEKQPHGERTVLTKPKILTVKIEWKQVEQRENSATRYVMAAATYHGLINACKPSAS